MRFTPFKNFLVARLPAPYSTTPFIPGPDEENAPPGRFGMLSLIGGPGLNTDGLFDGRSYQVLAVGEQGSFDDAEAFAFAIDHVLISAYSQSVEGTWLTSIVRQGGPPTPLSVDDAERTRFTCNYILDVQSSVA